MTVVWKQKDICNDEEYSSDDDADGNDARDSKDGDGTGERECDEPCTLQEPGEDVEQERECDFSVEISDGINSEDSGQEPPCVSVSSGSSCYKIVGDNIDKNIRPSFQRVSHQTKSLHYFHSYDLTAF